MRKKKTQGTKNVHKKIKKINKIVATIKSFLCILAKFTNLLISVVDTITTILLWQIFV